MISLQDIKAFCQLNYLDSGIPVYIYRNNTLLQAFPEQSTCTYPPKHYIEEFAEMTDDIAHLSTPVSYTHLDVYKRQVYRTI